MSSFYLVLKNLTRNKLRLILNCFALLIAFLIFGVLGAIKTAFDAGIDLAADDRLVTVNKINFTQPMPIAYVNKIRAIEGVEYVTYANWFGSYYQDPRNQAMGFAVDPESYLDVYPEILLSEEEKQKWFSTRDAMVVGEAMARRFNWKVGDRIPISSNIFSQQDGSNTWDLEIAGIYTGETPQTDTSYLMLHYEYFIETQTFGSDWIGWIALTTGDSGRNEAVAQAIDEQFANSPAETETTTEKQFNKAFIEQIGSIGLIITSVVLAAFFTILMIVGNSMALAVRERTREIAVLKTLGFSSKSVFTMVLSESLLLSLMGGLIGIGLAYLAVGGIAQAQNILTNLAITDQVLMQAVGYMILLGLVTGFFPAYQAMKLNTIDALNRS